MPEMTAVPSIVTGYAGVLGLMWIVLFFLAGRHRGGPDGVSIGDGGKVELIVAMRRHANFVESVPLTLLLLALLEMNDVSGTAIHGLGSALVVFRACHAYGFRADESKKLFRALGAGGTTLVIAISSIWAITLF